MCRNISLMWSYRCWSVASCLACSYPSTERSARSPPVAQSHRFADPADDDPFPAPTISCRFSSACSSSLAKRRVSNVSMGDASGSWKKRAMKMKSSLLQRFGWSVIRKTFDTLVEFLSVRKFQSQKNSTRNRASQDNPDLNREARLEWPLKVRILYKVVLEILAYVCMGRDDKDLVKSTSVVKFPSRAESPSQVAESLSSMGHTQLYAVTARVQTAFVTISYALIVL